ncbi:MAG TPA: hypothetical protein VJ023_19820 [Pyrinomonadaceae bacterium]|nr:hypothetical protein [Pyrinomonadaceae bacterium]
MDAPTRKITIKYPGKKGTEIFSGILAYSSKLKMKDGSVQEIIPGIRVRAFYKSDHETEGGQKKKINRVFRIEFLGRDEYVRLHNQLKVDPSTAVARAENDDLPSISPLKVYLAIAYSNVQQSLVDWTNKWKPCSASGQLRNETVHLWPGTYERVTFTSGSPSSSGGRVRARHHRSR